MRDLIPVSPAGQGFQTVIVDMYGGSSGIVLKNINRALRPKGFYLMQDIRAKTQVGDNLDHPLAPLLYREFHL
ncbi:MAG: hypothetical protein QNJ54_36190 [Prochloraceae cyanobacterium]|nr:hypothetical protein [Prochloraceae cyanobacterium]